MLLTPTDQFNRVETSRTAATGRGMSVDTARIGEEITINAHGRLHGARMEDFGHNIGFIVQRICWTHCVEFVAIGTRFGATAVRAQ